MLSQKEETQETACVGMLQQKAGSQPKLLAGSFPQQMLLGTLNTSFFAHCYGKKSSLTFTFALTNLPFSHEWQALLRMLLHY